MDGLLLKELSSSGSNGKAPDEEEEEKKRHLSIIKKWSSVLKVEDGRDSERRGKSHLPIPRLSPRSEQHAMTDYWRLQRSPRGQQQLDLVGGNLSNLLSESEPSFESRLQEEETRHADGNSLPVGLSMTGNPLTSDGQSRREMEELQQLNVQLMSRLFQLQNEQEHVRSGGMPDGADGGCWQMRTNLVGERRAEQEELTGLRYRVQQLEQELQGLR